MAGTRQCEASGLGTTLLNLSIQGVFMLSPYNQEVGMRE